MALQKPNLEEQVYLLQHLGNVNLFGKKKKIRFSQIKILYQLHLYGKNVRNGKWATVSPRRETIAEHCGLHRDTVRAFICDPAFSVFGQVDHSFMKSNSYHLFSWVVDLFNAFERLGMMKGFNKDFERWKRIFSQRLLGAFLPLVQKGYSLNEIVNKLSTKRHVKSATGKGVKSATTTYSRSTTASRSRSNNERPPPLDVVNGFSGLADALRNRFLIREGDINMVMKRYSYYHLKSACHLLNSWKMNGMEIESPIKAYQKCLNKTSIRK